MDHLVGRPIGVFTEMSGTYGVLKHDGDGQYTVIADGGFITFDEAEVINMYFSGVEDLLIISLFRY